MPWFGYIHPLLAIGTMVYGVRIAQVSVSRLLEWDFPLRQQRNRTVIFFLLVIANLVLGFLVNAALRGQGRGVSLTFHLPLAIIICVLALLATLVTFTRARKPGEVSGLMKFHPWLVVLPVVGIMTAGLIGLLKAFGI
jgi:cytochrome bd-type quinol oxidase subunit 2